MEQGIVLDIIVNWDGVFFLGNLFFVDLFVYSQFVFDGKVYIVSVVFVLLYIIECFNFFG